MKKSQNIMKVVVDTNSCSHPRLKKRQKEQSLSQSENGKPKERLKICQKEFKDEAKMTRLHRSKHIVHIKEEIKKNEVENDNIEINSNFPIRGKLKPLHKGKLILERNKELEDLDDKCYDANINMNESEKVENDKKIIDKIIQKLTASGNYHVEHNKAENSVVIRRSKKQTTNMDGYSVMQFVSREGTR